jgi:hypothetical protein
VRVALLSFLVLGGCFLSSPLLPRQTPVSKTSTASPFEVNLIIQEAIYGGVSGVSRRQEPVTVGVPLPDTAAIKSTTQLGLTGASAGQFRILGRWPSGNIEWLLVDTIADVPAGKTNTSISLTNGSGNFGGPSLATESGGRISVSTGPATFSIRKSKFNLIDEAAVGAHTDQD